MSLLQQLIHLNLHCSHNTKLITLQIFSYSSFRIWCSFRFD